MSTICQTSLGILASAYKDYKNHVIFDPHRGSHPKSNQPLCQANTHVHQMAPMSACVCISQWPLLPSLVPLHLILCARSYPQA